MSYEKKIEKLKKLKELAERGEPNERDVARTKLNEMLEKHGISESEIDKPDVVRRAFRYKKCEDNKSILCQVIWSVVASASIFSHKTKKEVYVETDYAQYIEIVEKYKHFACIFEKQKASFITAFILKNELYSKGTGEEKDNEKEMSKEELSQVLGMMSSLKKEHFVNTNRQIEKANG